MAQSNSIGAALVIGFIVYITVKGELPAYLCVIGIGSNCPAPQSGQVPSSNSSAQPVNVTVNNYVGTGQSSNSTTVISGNGTSSNTGSNSNINSTGGNIPVFTTTEPGGGTSGCDAYGDTDQSVCDAINNLGTGYTLGFGDNGFGDDE